MIEWTGSLKFNRECESWCTDHHPTFPGRDSYLLLLSYSEINSWNAGHFRKISDRSQHNTWIFGPCQIFDDICVSHARMERLELISNMIYWKFIHNFLEMFQSWRPPPLKQQNLFCVPNGLSWWLVSSLERLFPSPRPPKTASARYLPMQHHIVCNNMYTNCTLKNYIHIS